MAANVAALDERAPGSPALGRYVEIGRLLSGTPGATIADGIRWVHRLVTDLAVPALREHGVTAGDIPAIVAEAQRASSMKGNPIPLTDTELAQVLRDAL
jgi:alcohol dehydrogenase class IV